MNKTLQQLLTFICVVICLVIIAGLIWVAYHASQEAVEDEKLKQNLTTEQLETLGWD